MSAGVAERQEAAGARSPAGLVVAADVGGTFTDLVGVVGDRFVVAKVPSTPADPGAAVIQGLEEICATLHTDAERLAVMLHGTTVATNTILQRSGAVTALVTTTGFRDVLEIARQSRPRLFDFDARRAEPLIPRSLRKDVSERTSPRGDVVETLDEEALGGLLDDLKERGVEAIAVSFLHSYANPGNERKAREVIAASWPDVHVSLSSDVIPEYREYERTSTTGVNAFVAPVMTRYLEKLERRLRSRRFSGPLRVMQSNGGVMPASRAVELPAATFLSGVAAGALGGVRIASDAGQTLALTLDMGGTSCDLALGVDGAVTTSRRGEIDGLPVSLPMLDVHTIGAGGGSIAYLDPAGALKVGPRSAGADPGPAAYGLGGVEPTVTDANLVLGRLPPRGLIGGSLALHKDLATAAIQRVADPLGLSIEQAAAGIVRVVNASMARQMRVLTVERGVDPRDCALVAFGGGGPAHAAELADELGMKHVIVPPNPGVTSALGLVLAEPKADQVRTVLVDFDGSEESSQETVRRLRDVYEALQADLIGSILPVDDEQHLTMTRAAEMRYRRQGHVLSVNLEGEAIDARSLEALVDAFHDAHRRRFGYAVPGEPVTVVNAIMTVTVGKSPPALRPTPEEPAAATDGTRPVFFGGAWHQARVLPRHGLSPEQRVHGPAVVEQLDSTTVIPPGVVAQIDDSGNLHLTAHG